MYLRLLTKEDYPLIMAWRSNPLVYEGFYQQKEPLKWQEHIAWIQSRNQDWRNLIVMYEDRPVGVVTIGQLDYWEFEVGIYIGEITLWGKGIAKEALKLAITIGKDYGKDYCRVTILDENVRSKKLFVGLGFKRVGNARNGESLYRKVLKNVAMAEMAK